MRIRQETLQYFQGVYEINHKYHHIDSEEIR